MVLYAKEFKVPTVSLRYFTVFGPRQRPDMAFHRFIRAGLTKEALSLFGDGEQSRDFTFISDIVEANILAAERGPSGSVFNVGGGVQATVNEVLAIIESLVGPLTINRLERQAGDARHTSADTTKAREILGFNPQVKLKEGIAQEAEWLRMVLAK
jgi:nucleoside-diphosphate-sugar epimerase